MRPKKKILVVDSDEQRLSMRKVVLHTRGFEVLTAESGAEALRLLELYPAGTLDLLLAELEMEGMGGNLLAARAKKLRPNLPVLVISRSVTDPGAAPAADCFLPKGANAVEIVLERMRVLTAKKRGPQRGWTRLNPPAKKAVAA